MLDQLRGNIQGFTYPPTPYIYYVYIPWFWIVSFSMNCKIHPVLYKCYLHLRERLGAKIVHRRKRRSSMCIEIIFYCDAIKDLRGHLNALKEAEVDTFWVICRRKPNCFYEGRQVYLLFLTPIHPKKRRERGTTVTPLSSNINSASPIAEVG